MQVASDQVTAFLIKPAGGVVPSVPNHLRACRKPGGAGPDWGDAAAEMPAIFPRQMAMVRGFPSGTSGLTPVAAAAKAICNGSIPRSV